MKLFALLCVLVASSPAAPSAPPAHPTGGPSAAPLSPDELFSRRALRRARLLIQMRMLQLQEERLECVREALRRRLPDALWPEEPTPSRGTPDTSAAASKCARLPE